MEPVRERPGKPAVRYVKDEILLKFHRGVAQAQIEGLLTQHNLTFDLVRTEGVGHGIELTRQVVREGCSLIVAAGGDGTLNDVTVLLVDGDQGEGGNGREDQKPEEDAEGK